MNCPTKNWVLNQGLLHIWSNFVNPSLSGWFVIGRTSSWLTHTRTHTHTHRRRQRQHPEAKTVLGYKSWKFYHVTKHNIIIYKVNWKSHHVQLIHSLQLSQSYCNRGHCVWHRQVWCHCSILLQQIMKDINGPTSAMLHSSFGSSSNTHGNSALPTQRPWWGAWPALHWQIHIDSSVQRCGNSSALAMELLQSCTKSSTCTLL